MSITASADAKIPSDTRGAKILVLLIVVSLLLLAGYLFVYRTIREEVTLDKKLIFREELPNFIDKVTLFRANGGVIVQLFIPERNTRLHIVVPDQPFAPTEAPANLLEAIRSFRIRKEGATSLHPLILSFFSAQLDSRRSEREGVLSLRIQDREMPAEQVASLKGDEHFLFSVIPFEDSQIGVVGFTTKRAVTPVDIQPALSAVVERLALPSRIRWSR
jgi:hypothetical protein